MASTATTHLTNLSLKNFLIKEPNLMKDVINFRWYELNHLIRRLEVATQTIKQISPSLDPQSRDVCDFVSQVIYCFLASTENKITRCLERILVATGTNCQNFVLVTLGQKLADLLGKLSNAQDLRKVSAMLEHSKLIQQVMPDCMSILLNQLQGLITELMDCLPTADVHREDVDKLFYTVKLCLQLFQLFPDLSQQGWGYLQQFVTTDALNPGQHKDPIAVVVKGLLDVLTRKCYSRDTTLIAGTTVAMLINAASTPDESAQCFFSIYAAVSGNKAFPQMTSLKPKEAPTNETLHTGHNHTAEIALLRSIIIGSSQKLLCLEVMDLFQLPHPQAFLLSLFPVVCYLCDTSTEFHYLSFQLLSLWFEKLSICLPILNQQRKHTDIMDKDSVFIAETLKRVWLSWESPVDGVAEFVAGTFKTLLKVWSSEMALAGNWDAQLADQLIRRVLQMPWYARSRYIPLSLLIPYVDTDQVLAETKNLKQELLECMGANFLAALASDAYTAFLHSIRNKCDINEQTNKWKNTWLTCLISGLTNSNNLIRSKVCAYWLPSTLKILSGAGPLLQHYLEETLLAEGNHSEHSALLFAWLAVCRHIRTFTVLDLVKLPKLLLVEAIYSDNEEICAEAMSLISTTQKKAEPLGEVEIELLQAVLPYCLKMDSAPFRQVLVMSLKKIFVRVRDSCSTAIKRKMQVKFIDPSLQFINWLYSLMMASLAPGACFQRRRTCLDIVQAWLETIIFVESDNAKKGKAQGPMDVLMKYAHSQGMWNFFSSDNRTCVLHCVVDGADEIQESAMHILSKYFPWSPESSSTDIILHLLNHGLDLCNSPRAYENRSGSLLIRLVYQKFVKEQNFHVHFDGNEPESEPESKRSLKAGGTKAVCAAFFNNVLLKKIETSLAVAEKDALLASRCNPTHGMLQAAVECLHTGECASKSMSAEDWHDILMTTVELSTHTITLVLRVLAGGQTGNCPSFAEMGMALEQLVEEGCAEQEATSSVSPEFQLLLSWCWLNLKESCTCLGVAMALATKDACLKTDVAESVGNTFLQVLTHCRHRGAIEGCRNGFLQFCTSLMTCDDSSLSAIPANILNRVLSGLENNEMTSSVTRRSAGLPIIVQTIMQAENRCKMSNLLHQTVTRLYTVASRPPCSGSDQTQDQAPVHALNVLKTIFSDASLSRELLCHLGSVMQLVIDSFESSVWAVRNAATQLVSTLVTRMFGQRNKASLSCSTMTLKEWAAHFPQLLAFVEAKLDNSLGAGDSITDIQPSLFLILTLLASLGPAAESAHCHRLTPVLHTTVLNTVSSPVYFLRELSAAAVVALTPVDATDTCVKKLLSHLGPEMLHRKSSNHFHGILMCLDKLLASRKVSSETAEVVVTHVLKNRELISPLMLCPLVCAKCVDVVARAIPVLSSGSSLNIMMLTALTEALCSTAGGQLQFGGSLFTKSATSLVFSLLHQGEETSAMSLSGFVTQCLTSQDAELRTAVLECILQKKESVLKSSAGKDVLETLWQQFSKETNASCIVSISKILVTSRLEEHLPHADLGIDISLDDMSALRSKFARLACVQAALHPVEALVLSWHLDQVTDCTASDRLLSSVHKWGSRLYEFSQPHQNEDFRMAAAEALSLAGQTVFFSFLQSTSATLESTVVRLAEACMVLLEEADSDIRRVVTHFVGGLHWEKKNPKISHMNTNLCSKIFFAYLCDELGHLCAVHQLLVNKLYMPGELATCLHRLTQPRNQYLFEHEENTFFSENIMQKLDIYEALKSTAVGSKQIHVIQDLLTELTTALSELEKNMTKQAVYNLCGDSGVMAALTGLVMCIQLLSSSAEGSQNAQLPTQVSPVLKKLQQVPNLHPAISTFLHFV